MLINNNLKDLTIEKLTQLRSAALQLAEEAEWIKDMLCVVNDDYFDGVDIRYIRNAENATWNCCNALADIIREPLLSCNDSYDASAKLNHIVMITQVESKILIKAPHMRRLAHRCDSRVVYSDLIDGIYCIDRSKFLARQVDMYVLSTYFSDTPHEFVIDPDNVNIKALGDPLTQLLGIDDNGLNVHLHVYGTVTDVVQPATYLYLVPRTEKTLSAAELLKEIEKLLTAKL